MGCPIETSETISVEVYEDLHPGTISGSDTICYNTIPNELSQAVLPSGGDGVFTYQWQEKNSTGWNDIDGATTTSFQPSALIQTTTYRLKITNECGVVYSNEQTIYVRSELTAPTIQDNKETICYNTQPSALSISIPAKGGSDDTFTYQWQEAKEGTSFTDILGAIGSTYQPSSLKSDCYYRVIATSDKGCGSIVSSNNVKISVYEPLSIKTEGIEPLCYMSQGTVKVVASGAGDDFTYQWQESTDNISFYNCTVNATNAEYTTAPKAAGTYYYRCVITPTKGCDTKISDVIVVDVKTGLISGTIGTEHAICYMEDANELVFTTPSSGSMKPYNYQWQCSYDLSTWENIQEFSSSYIPRKLKQTTYFRVITSNKCASVTSNVVCVTVNPLPIPQEIKGNNSVCYNQYDWYAVDLLNTGFEYEWSLDNEIGEIISETSNVDSIEVYWKIPNRTDNVVLKVTNINTGCTFENKLPINTCNEKAPERTTIVRKGTSNILICEAKDMFYTWGYTDNATNKRSVIESSKYNYVLYPTLDFTNNSYWVDLRYSSDSKCYSISYFNDKDVSIQNIYPYKLIRNEVGIELKIENPEHEHVFYYIFNSLGQLVSVGDFCSEDNFSTILQLSSPGVYVINIRIGDKNYSDKIIMF